MPRFVILWHETPPGHERASHWDFMLERGNVLRTWAMSVKPVVGVRQVAQRLADHRIAYLEYEGEISHDRGRVSQWDSGTYEILSETSTWLEAQIFGRIIRSNVVIERIDDRRDVIALDYVT